ncbi:MAG: hypothetical protein QF664_10400 [Dehalococcoidia bacterium]|jgi:hypothetical protein|nr:hypothetical protein [Dehalococcoidia bacterium]
MIRVTLWVLIASVVVGALMGVWALLSGDFDETDGRLLGTTFSVTGAAALVIVFGRALERPGLGRLPYGGFALTAVSFVAIVAGIWAEVDAGWYWKLATSLTVVTLTAAHASLVSPAGLAVAFRWVARAAIGTGIVLALLILVMMWVPASSDAIWRGIGVFAILSSAASIAVPVMRRLSRIPEPVDRSALVNFCPRCGEAMAELPGNIECPGCGARARVEFSAG